MSEFHTHVARLARAAETVAPQTERKLQTVAVALNEEAQSLPPHIIAATDPVKLNKQAQIFRCPAWAGLPSRPYHLHCERAGVPFPALGLHRFPYYLFGKNNVCDYVLEHPSVSSVHAALIFNKEHECFVLLDLGSTNGTRLGGRRVEPRKPVPIVVGSVLQFGYSTRTYELRAGAAGALKRTREGGETESQRSPKAPIKLENGSQRSVAAAATAAVSTMSTVAEVAQSASSPTTFSLGAVVVDDAQPFESTATSERIDAAAHSGSSGGVHTKDSETTRREAVEKEVEENKRHISADETTAITEGGVLSASAPESVAIHLYQLVIKHKNAANPVSRGRNKGEVITRAKADALEIVRFIVKEHQAEVPVDSALGFSPWTVEQFVAAVHEYCEVSSKKKAGDLGMVEKGTFSDDFDEAAFRLRRGEVSAPVETQLGIHLLFRCD